MELNEIRDKIDAVDDELLKLFLERMELSERVAEVKSEKKLPIENRQREREILSRVSAAAGDRERYAYQLYSSIFELSRARQAELIDCPTGVGAQIKSCLEAEQELFPQSATVACQGIEGGNSQLACDKLLPRGSIVYVKSFEAVFSAVKSGLCRFGVLPIENSSNGSVRAVYELLQHNDFSVVRSTRLCIRHELLALPGTRLEDITEIYSHEQALGQCSAFLENHKNIKLIPCDNTAVAARLVSESGRRDVAAIASGGCAGLYGLECLTDEIQNSDNNYTRFICISKDPELYAGANRLSLVIGCEDRPGALYEILAKLAALGVNMTKLESCPVSGSDFEFIFFLEIQASLHDRAVAGMLCELERSCRSFSLLGSYAEV